MWLWHCFRSRFSSQNWNETRFQYRNDDCFWYIFRNETQEFLFKPSDYATKQIVMSGCNLKLFWLFWLLRYPRPIWCIHDCGTKFMAPIFKEYFSILASRM
jgi:hypothetical protein